MMLRLEESGTLVHAALSVTQPAPKGASETGALIAAEGQPEAGAGLGDFHAQAPSSSIFVDRA